MAGAGGSGVGATTAILDPQSLVSWEDAFQHPLPVVRRLEQQLRQNVEANRDKLRSLVGSRYRDLLGTAERIITMDVQMQEVEQTLGAIGKKCNARTLDRIVENHSRMRAVRDEGSVSRYAAVAQTKVLQASLNMVARVIRGRGDALLAAKLLVLARLVHKSVAESRNAPGVLETLRRKLVMLRTKLLSYVERALVRPVTEKTFLAHTLAAYALVTSSTPKEVLRHFLQVRYEQLDAGTRESSSETEILRMLDLYSQTLLDTRDLFPRRFAEVLSQLAQVELLQDTQIRSVYELNLDVYESWIADDVRSFTPWVRHDQLAGTEVTEALTTWTTQAQQSLLQGLETCLQGQRDVHVILEIRRKVLSKYLSLNSRLRNESHAQAVHALRRTFLQKMESLAVEYTQSVNLSFEVPESQGLSQKQNLWDLASTQLELARGAPELRKAVLQARHGYSSGVETETKKIDEFFKHMNKLWDAIEVMRGSKWEEDVDFELDDLDDGRALQTSLTKQDPDHIQQALRKANGDALKQIYTHLSAVSTDTPHPTFVIRVFREVDHRARGLGDRLPMTLQDLRADSVAGNLHGKIARDVARKPMESLLRDLKSPSKFSKTNAMVLWDGTPPLPVQPSPGTFRFLMDLHREMTHMGNDLWSPACVAQVKIVVQKGLVDDLTDYDFDSADDVKVNALANGHVEDGEENDEGNQKDKVEDEKGDVSTEEAREEQQEQDQEREQETDATEVPPPIKSVEDEKRQRGLQRLFDVLYLEQMLSSRSDALKTQPLVNLVAALQKHIDIGTASAHERLRQSAHNYWVRTHLLFGLLAVDTSI